MRSRRVVFAAVLLAFAWAGVTCSAAMPPAGSRELAWIESDGAAWIDTGVRASSRVNLAFEGTVFDSAGYSCLVGADDKLAPEALGLWVNYEGRLAMVRGGVTAPWLGESVLGCACVVSNCATRLFRNDKEVFANVEPATFASPLTLTVFNCRRNERSVESFAGRALHARLTRLRVWEGDALVRDFRPCRDSSGEAGLWDRVGGTFFGNRGKGRLRGSDEPPPPSCGERPLVVRRNLSRPGDAIRIGGFWGEQYRMLIEKWLPHCILQLEKGGHASGSHLRTYGEGLYNLRAAGEKLRGGHPWISPSRTWMDGVVFNVAEAMCLALEIGEDPALRAKLEEWIPVFLAAQEKSGYIHSMVTVTGKPHFAVEDFHELYTMGYFIELGVAHMRLTDGKDRRLFDAARRCADHLDATFGPRPKRTWRNGHPGVEYALIRLAEACEQWDGVGSGRRYAALARHFLRHQHETRAPQVANQSEMPAVLRTEMRGHAVRAMYFGNGLGGAGRLCDDFALARASDRLFDNVVDNKLYLTGGVGVNTSEAMGANCELPHNGYCEACAGCGLAFWCLTRTRAKAADERAHAVYERVLYNNVLGAIGADGRHFFYRNPLTSALVRDSWHGSPCCVGNIARTLLALKDNLLAVSADGTTLYVNNYMDIETDDFRMETAYPFDGKVAFTLKRGHYDRILARFPDRAESRLYRMSPAVAHGYREVKGAWELPLPEQKVTAIDEVKACAGQEAFQRGPLVYSWEGPNFTIKVPNYRRLNNGGESRVWKKK